MGKEGEGWGRRGKGGEGKEKRRADGDREQSGVERGGESKNEACIHTHSCH